METTKTKKSFMKSIIGTIEKTLSIFLCLAMVVTMFPGLVLGLPEVGEGLFAEEPPTVAQANPAGGVEEPGFIGSFETMSWNDGSYPTAPGQGIIATMTVTNSVTTAFLGGSNRTVGDQTKIYRDSQWYAPAIGGTWSVANDTITNANIDIIKNSPNKELYIYTPMTGMSSPGPALPYVEASVTVDMDPSITDVGDNFLSGYSYGRSFKQGGSSYTYGGQKLTSLGVPDTSNVTSIGYNFMGAFLFAGYAAGCTSLQTLAAPVINSNVISVGENFMGAYASGCTSLQTLAVPNTSNIENIGQCFMMYYANGCRSLQTLAAPNVSGMINVDENETFMFMDGYATGCTSLISLDVPDLSGWTKTGDHFMSSYAMGCNSLQTFGVPDTSSITTFGSYFMENYATNCTSLESLDAPVINNEAIIAGGYNGSGFLRFYAAGCTSLTTLAIPDTSNLTNIGCEYFMQSYAQGCTSLETLGAPDFSKVKKLGFSRFLESYAEGCTSLKSLDAPDLSNVKEISDYGFMANYAKGCTSLTNLAMPDLSKVGKLSGSQFMESFAQGCTSLQTLDVPDLSKVSYFNVGENFMRSYAEGCTSLETLAIPNIDWVSGNPVKYYVDYATPAYYQTRYFMSSYAEGCNNLTELVTTSISVFYKRFNINLGIQEDRLGELSIRVPEGTKTMWAKLAVDGNDDGVVQKTEVVFVDYEDDQPVYQSRYTEGDPTLYQNYIQDADDIIEGGNVINPNSKTAPTVATGLVFNDAEQNLLTAPSTSDTGTVIYYVASSNSYPAPPSNIEDVITKYFLGDYYALLNFTTDYTDIKGKYADTYTVWYFDAEDVYNYISGVPITQQSSIKVKITGPELVITAKDVKRVFGEPDKFTTAGILPGDNFLSEVINSMGLIQITFELEGDYPEGERPIGQYDMTPISWTMGEENEGLKQMLENANTIVLAPGTYKVVDELEVTIGTELGELTNGVVATMTVAPDAVLTEPKEMMHGTYNDGEEEVSYGSIWFAPGLDGINDEIRTFDDLMGYLMLGQITISEDPITPEDIEIIREAHNKKIYIITNMYTWALDAMLNKDWFNEAGAILPNIKADVAVDTAPTIEEVPSLLMYRYAKDCTNLTSLGVPNTSNFTNVSHYFMSSYAQGCTSLTSLGAPDLSGVTELEVDYKAVSDFMSSYATGCTSLKRLDVPDTRNMTSSGCSFMSFYAFGCTSLKSLGVPDTSNMTSIYSGFMMCYALACPSLKSLGVPDTSSLTEVDGEFMLGYTGSLVGILEGMGMEEEEIDGMVEIFASIYGVNPYDGCDKLTKLVATSGPEWFAENPIDWGIQADKLGEIRIVVPEGTKAAWQAIAHDGDPERVVEKSRYETQPDPYKEGDTMSVFVPGDPTLMQNYVTFVVGTGDEGYTKAVPTTAIGLTYNGDDQNLLTGPSSSDAGVVRYYATTEDLDIDTVIERYLEGEPGFYSQFASIKGKDAGEYTIWYFDATDVDAHELGEEIIDQCSVTVEIAKKGITVTAKDATKIVGDPDIDLYTTTEFTVTGLVGGDSIEGVTLALSGAITGEDRPDGTYSITPSAAVFGTGSASNYNVTYVNGQYVVDLGTPVENDEGEKVVVTGKFVFENMQEVPGVKTYAERLQTVGEYDDSKMGYKDIMLGVAPNNNEDRMKYYSYATGASVDEETGEVTLTFDKGVKETSAISNYAFVISAPGLTAVIVNSASLSYEDDQFTLDLTSKGELRMYAGLRNFDSETFKIDVRLQNDGGITRRIGIGGPQFDYNQILSASDEANVFIKAYQALDIDGDGRLTASDIIFLEQNYGKKPMQFNY